jgi:hypothetical protein
MGMLRDEGIGNLLALMGWTMTRRAYLRKMIWMMWRMLRVMPYLGYIVLVGTKRAPIRDEDGNYKARLGQFSLVGVAFWGLNWPNLQRSKEA